VNGSERWTPIGGSNTALNHNLIKRVWFRYFNPIDLPTRTSLTKIVQSWDVASRTGDSNDYSVCTTWRIEKDNVYLLHVFRARLEYPDLRRKFGELANEFGAATTLIEEAGPGLALLDDLKTSPPPGLNRPIGVKPDGGKSERMESQTAKIEAGHVLIRVDAPWLDDFLAELLAFPHGRHDDQVDSVSQFLTWWQRDRARYDAPIVMPYFVSRTRDFPG
jgi:predicted phage terminase large subunit-like protein